MKIRRVCQIAYDSGLLSTRELLLKSAGLEVTSFLGNNAAMAGLTRGFELFVICHAAPLETRREMVRWLKQRFPSSPVIALSPEGPAWQHVDNADKHAVYRDPEDWLKAVCSMLSEG